MTFTALAGGGPGCVFVMNRRNTRMLRQIRSGPKAPSGRRTPNKTGWNFPFQLIVIPSCQGKSTRRKFALAINK